MAKSFKIPGDHIQCLIPEQGGGFATDRIMVDGCPVGFMYRESSDSPTDSGWRFFSGDESQDYADEPDHFGIYSLNMIANYDPSIIPYLSADVGSAYGRGDDGEWVAEDFPLEPSSN